MTRQGSALPRLICTFMHLHKPAYLNALRATVQFRTPVSPKGTVRVHHISEPVVKTQVKYEPVQTMYTISNSQSNNPSIGLPRNLSSYLFELSRKSNFPNRRGSDLSFPSVDRPILALARSPHRTALHLPVLSVLQPDFRSFPHLFASLVTNL